MISVEVNLPGGEPEYVDIVRVSGDTNPDTVNEYRVRYGLMTARFSHRYGDGWLVCVRKAFDAIARKP